MLCWGSHFSAATWGFDIGLLPSKERLGCDITARTVLQSTLLHHPKGARIVLSGMMPTKGMLRGVDAQPSPNPQQVLRLLTGLPAKLDRAANGLICPAAVASILEMC